MNESSYYDNPLLWQESNYLSNENQLNRFKVCYSLIPDTVETVLDVGTGNGAFLAFLEKSGENGRLKCTGFERSKTAIQSAVCNSHLVQGNLDDITFENQSFDLTSALEVIEHLPYRVYEKGLQEIERVSRDYILISVPYKEKQIPVQCPYCHCAFHPNYHMRSFDETNIHNLFELFELKKFQLIDITVESYLIPWISLFRENFNFIGKQFPQYALCPQCGFTKSSSQNTVGKLPRSNSKKFKEFVKSSLPKRRKSRKNWIVGLYQRK